LSFGGGYAVESWHTGAEIEKLKGTNTELTAANDRCVNDIKSANAAVQAMTAVAAERERQAVESMKQIQPEVQVHAARITRIKALPQIAPDMQCEAIKQEQIEYVRERRTE
jgi:hypothetical protein